MLGIATPSVLWKNCHELILKSIHGPEATFMLMSSDPGFWSMYDPVCGLCTLLNIILLTVNRPGVPFELKHCCGYQAGDMFEEEATGDDFVYFMSCNTPTGQ